MLLACAAAWPLFAHPGLLNTRGGGDSPFLLQRVQQLEVALRQGHFPVRWMPDANYGYGYPFFNFYAPLSIYITVLFRFLGFSYVRAIELSQLAGFIVAGWGMYVLARRWFKSELAGGLAAVAYTFAPFHMVNVYVRGDSLAEFWAMAFYPLVILAADDLFAAFQKGADRKRPIVRFSLAYAALILSHNISALIFTPFVGLYLLIRWWQLAQNRWRPNVWGSVVIAVVLALALAAWFFVPALREQSFAQLEPVTEGYFHFSNHFRGRDLVQTGFFFDYSPNGGKAFRMGLVQAVVMLLGLGSLLWPGNRFVAVPYRLFVLLVTLVATFMITPLSGSLWAHLPLVPFTQFPWRFLSVQAFGGALATAVLACWPRSRWITPITAVLLLLAAFGNLRTDHLPLTDADITPEKLAQYEWFTGNIGSTVSAEYLPPTVKPRYYTGAWLNTGERFAPHWLAGTGKVLAQPQAGGTRLAWRLDVQETAVVLFPVMYWPGWQAQVDGSPIPIEPANDSGLITVKLLPGTHLVTFRLGRTPVRLWAELLSLTAVLLAIWLYRPRLALPNRRLILLAGSGLLLSAGLRFWPTQTLAPHNLTWDFAQMGYLHHDTNGVLYDNGVRLVSYQYSAEEVEAGETLTVWVNWEDDGNTAVSATLQLVSPAVNRFDNVPPVVASTQLVTPQTAYHLSIPTNAPAGLFVPRLTVENGRPLLPSGQTRGDLFLRPVRIRATHSEPSGENGRSLDVRPVRVMLTNPRTLFVQLAWYTAKPQTHNYNASLRLVDATGRQYAQSDIQPGFGFLPAMLWPSGEWVNDWLTLSIADDVDAIEPYTLLVQLYVWQTGEPVLTRQLGKLAHEAGKLVWLPPEPVFSLPENVALTEETAVFGPTTASTFQPLIQLIGYQWTQTNDQLALTLYWQALTTGEVDYTRFVHLVDPATNTIVAQQDNYPVQGTYPTGQWTTGEIVADPITLSLNDVPPGDYVLMTGFYRNMGNGVLSQLTAVLPDGTPLPDDRKPLSAVIHIPPNP
ncbi:MAG: hypothetical protein D6706_11525 [Chloroflexi bacterium]|nr:MAG: hypothetical protein D6706_11525 [Chloroflexota bacterium]